MSSIPAVYQENLELLREGFTIPSGGVALVLAKDPNGKDTTLLCLQLVKTEAAGGGRDLVPIAIMLPATQMLNHFTVEGCKVEEW